MVRASALLCWLCGEGENPFDPWQADHYLPGVKDSPLLPAHRRCNAKRGDRPALPHPAYARLMVSTHDPIVEVLDTLGCSLKEYANE
jgi:hypothetical protein